MFLLVFFAILTPFIISWLLFGDLRESTIIVTGLVTIILTVMLGYFIQNKINIARERERVSFADVLLKKLEKTYLRDPEVAKQYQGRVDEVIKEERRARLSKMPLSKETRKMAEQLLKDWEKEQEKMK